MELARSIETNVMTEAEAVAPMPGGAGISTDSLLAPFERDVLLATGRSIRIRPTRPTDVEGLRSFYDELGPDSMYLRFFGQRSSIPDNELQRATVNDVDRHVALVAEFEGAIVGVGEYHAQPSRADAEVAFAVADAHHHEGIATVLLEDLAMIAKAAGIRRLVADTLPNNTAMQTVFRTVGLAHRSW
jgi:GNAT superfamily N-acetyltransferase